MAKSGARDELYDVPFTTGHTGYLHGGTALNIVPDIATFEFEFRVLAADKSDTLAKEVIDYAKNVLEPEMKAVAPEAGFDFRTAGEFAGLDTAADAEVNTLCEDSSRAAIATARSPRHRGRPVLAGRHSDGGVRPGSIDQAHKADEWIAMSELRNAVCFSDR